MSDAPSVPLKLILELDNHAKKFDELCPICTHKQRPLIERWYIQRHQYDKLENIFGFHRRLLDQHARAVKIFTKRANNTNLAVQLMIEQGIAALESGKMDLTAKDLAWAVNHQDRLLGRIREKVDIQQAPVLVLHTTVPGVGGIADADVKEIKAAKVLEPLQLAGESLVFAVPAEVIETKENKEIK